MLMIENFIKDRPVIAAHNSDPKNMRQLLINEINEYFDENDPELAARELADVLWFVLSIAVLREINILAEIREKGAVNHLKREAVLYQSGSYEDLDRQARLRAKETKLNERFYQKDT